MDILTPDQAGVEKKTNYCRKHAENYILNMTSRVDPLRATCLFSSFAPLCHGGARH